MVISLPFFDPLISMWGDYARIYGTVFEFGDVFCFTDFLSGFLYRVRVRV